MKRNYFNIKKFRNKINFGFFTSIGGVSEENFYSLNCGSNSGDKKNNVKKNISLALKSFNLKYENLKLVNQIHSNKIFHISKKNRNKIFYGDGLITNEKNLALGILTADCAPIFIFDNNYNTICCLHSGWKGSLGNIVREGIKKLKNINKSNNDITAIVGPCLGIKNFEVDKSFKLKFIRKNTSYSKFFRSKNSYKDLFDLRGLLNYQLKKEGIKKIYNIRKDTYKNSKIFFSHRRSTHQNKKESGRMINIIALRD